MAKIFCSQCGVFIEASEAVAICQDGVVEAYFHLDCVPEGAELLKVDVAANVVKQLKKQARKPEFDSKAMSLAEALAAVEGEAEGE
jgi:hypothetical protein